MCLLCAEPRAAESAGLTSSQVEHWEPREVPLTEGRALTGSAWVMCSPLGQIPGASKWTRPGHFLTILIQERGLRLAARITQMDNGRKLPGREHQPSIAGLNSLQSDSARTISSDCHCDPMRNAGHILFFSLQDAPWPCRGSWSHTYQNSLLFVENIVIKRIDAPNVLRCCLRQLLHTASSRYFD